MIGLQVRIIDQELIVNLNKVPAAIQSQLEAKLKTLMQELKAKVVENLSGKVLNSKSGALAGSLLDGVSHLGSSLIGFVEVNPEDPKVRAYAEVHEYGGKGYYEIVPVHKTVLRFVSKTGQIVFAPYVYHPPAAERSYLRSALAEMAPEIEAQLQEALADALRGA